MARIELRSPAGRRLFVVDDEQAAFWQARGYVRAPADAEPEPEPPKPAPRKRKPADD